jgi:hypothetical protein
MIEIVLLIWVILFLIFFVAGINVDNPIFGLVAGSLLLLLGLGIIVSGLQISSGMNITTVGGTTNIVYEYDDVSPPFSTWGLLFGVTLLAISIYIIYRNADEM